MLDAELKEVKNNGLYNRYEYYNEKYFKMVNNHSDYLTDNPDIDNRIIIQFIKDTCDFYDDMYRKCETWQHYNSSWYNEIHLLMDDLKGRLVTHIKMLEKYLKYDSEVSIQ